MITTPISISFHLVNPNLSSGEKAVMVGYELCVAGGGLLLAYGLANCWNPVGWVALGAPIVYTAITFVGGNALQGYLENN